MPGTFHSLHSFFPLFSSSVSAQGQLSHSKLGCSFHAARPSARDAAARAHRKVLLTHRRCSRAAALAWLDTHYGTRSCRLRACNVARYNFRAAADPGLLGNSRAKEKRALLLRGKTPSSRDTSCSPPPTSAARDLARKTHLSEGERLPGPVLAKLGFAAEVSV